MFDAAWFFTCFPEFNGVDLAIVEKQIALSESEVCWARRCGRFEWALALQTAIFLDQRGYPLSEDQSIPVAGSNDYDQIIKKHQVGDVTTEFQVIDKKSNAIRGADYQGQLDRLMRGCVGTLTNTHVLAGRGLRGLRNYGC